VKLPNRDKAAIEKEKLTKYLLNTEHKRGAAKAELLIQFGYDEKIGNDFGMTSEHSILTLRSRML